MKTLEDLYDALRELLEQAKVDRERYFQEMLQQYTGPSTSEITKLQAYHYDNHLSDMRQITQALIETIRIFGEKKETIVQKHGVDEKTTGIFQPMIEKFIGGFLDRLQSDPVSPPPPEIKPPVIPEIEHPLAYGGPQYQSEPHPGYEEFVPLEHTLRLKFEQLMEHAILYEIKPIEFLDSLPSDVQDFIIPQIEKLGAWEFFEQFAIQSKSRILQSVVARKWWEGAFGRVVKDVEQDAEKENLEKLYNIRTRLEKAIKTGLTAESFVKDEDSIELGKTNDIYYLLAEFGIRRFSQSFGSQILDSDDGRKWLRDLAVIMERTTDRRLPKASVVSISKENNTAADSEQQSDD